jgi:broad specificity phosphatase PhoE
MNALWPQQLWVVRHGQSAGNVAREAAEASGLTTIDIAFRDIDTPLSCLGEQQAIALGHWFGALPKSGQPEVVLSSPYVRAQHSAILLMQAAGLDDGKVVLRFDERLREREFGILDRLTVAGITQKYPELGAQRGHVGKFYFRPPGGESWCDVILRLRSLVEMITREYAAKRVLIVAHQVTVNCLRYLLEDLDEKRILEIDRQQDVPNCGVTSYRCCEDTVEGPGRLKLECVNFVAPLQESHTPVTKAPDQPSAPKP